MSTTIEVEVTGIECPFCGQQFFSRYRHDFRYCKCGYTFVDGGSDYLRYGYGVYYGNSKKQREMAALVNLAGMPTTVKMKGYKRVYTEEEQIAYRQAQMINVMGAYLK